MDTAHMSDAELAKAERDIARKYVGKVPWVMVTWAFLNLAVWLSLWPLVMFAGFPLWAAFLIATLNVMLSYLPSHEAQHSNIAKPGHSLRWLNELVGRVSTVPLVIPYTILRMTHMKHHAHTNDPELDPDYWNKADGWLNAIWQSIKNRQPGVTESYAVALEKMGDTPEVRFAVLESIVWRLTYFTVLFAMAWSGFALEVFFLWWLPRQIGMTYIQLFLSWAPHHPFEEQGRYRDTRGWRFALGNVASMGMQYHIVHHLHPAIPLFDTGRAYWDMREILKARGCQIDGL